MTTKWYYELNLFKFEKEKLELWRLNYKLKFDCQGQEMDAKRMLDRTGPSNACEKSSENVILILF